MVATSDSRMGVPRFKCKGISRDSFTVDRDPRNDELGGYGTPYKRGTPEFARRKAQLKRRGISAKPTITDYRHVRLSHLGVIRTHKTPQSP